mgnify:CR=1 FL=1
MSELGTYTKGFAIKTNKIVTTCERSMGLSGCLVPKHSWLRVLETSTADSILEKGVFLCDIIPHRATFGHFPKNGTCPCKPKTPDDCENSHFSPFHSLPQPILISFGVGNPNWWRTSRLRISGSLERISLFKSHRTHETVLVPGKFETRIFHLVFTRDSNSCSVSKYSS